MGIMEKKMETTVLGLLYTILVPFWGTLNITGICTKSVQQYDHRKYGYRGLHVSLWVGCYRGNKSFEKRNAHAIPSELGQLGLKLKGGSPTNLPILPD